MSTRKTSARKRAAKPAASKKAEKTPGTGPKTEGAPKKAAKKSSRAVARGSAKRGGVRQPASGTLRAAPPTAAASPHFPGFDTGSFPGEKVMRKWFANPFVFTGFYLEAPCHNAAKFTPYTGHRQLLKEIGWGFVVVYVGRQASGCGADKLTREQGLTDARDAIGKAKGNEFPEGATIFLDVERMEVTSAKMVNYMRGWIAGLLQDNFYKPGVYAHFHNAVDLFRSSQQEFTAQGQAGAAAFWVVRVPGGTRFDVLKSVPQDLKGFANTPISFAGVWQGKIDITSETHNGVKFGPVDEDVADSSNPSNG
jgi:hypothetical protein